MMHSIPERRVSRVASRKPSASGFTLLELMVAMTAGAIVISSMYFITSASTNYFREQQRISNVQSSLRYAMDQLRRDITRAGFGATPSSVAYPPRQVTGFPGAVNAIELVDLPGPDPSGAVHTVDGNALAADRLQLVGNYMTSSNYPIRGIGAAGTTVNVDANWTRFTRDFTGWINGAPYATLTAAGNPFDTAFAPGRLLCVRSGGGERYFSRIVGTDPTTATVTIGNPINASGLNPAWASPVSVMHYMPVPATGALVHNNVAIAGDNFVLVRREVQPGGGAVPLANTFDRVLAERVVHFNVDFMVNQVNVRSQPPILAPAIGAAAQAAPNERIFSALVTLAVRTALPDPRFRWIAQTGGAELTRFRYSAVNNGATRVRIARAEIFLPNVAYEWSNN